MQSASECAMREKKKKKKFRDQGSKLVLAYASKKCAGTGLTPRIVSSYPPLCVFSPRCCEPSGTGERANGYIRIRGPQYA